MEVFEGAAKIGKLRFKTKVIAYFYSLIKFRLLFIFSYTPNILKRSSFHGSLLVFHIISFVTMVVAKNLSRKQTISRVNYVRVCYVCLLLGSIVKAEEVIPSGRTVLK